jgi:glycosyltransferase involved in cell wall biosynthesis
MTLSIMHVTTVPQTLGFFRGQVGYLVRSGMAVTVVSSPGEMLDAFAAAEPVRAIAVPMARRFDPVRDVLSFARLVRTILRQQPHIVHAHTPKAALLGTVAARVTGRTAVLSIFGLPQMTRGGAARLVLDMKTRIECALAHRVWCDSRSMREYVIASRLCRADKVVVLGEGSVNGVDAAIRFNPDRFPPARRLAERHTWGIPPGAPVIGFIGRIVRDKGIHELAQAWRTLRERHPTLRLLMVGELEPGDPIDPAVEAALRRDDRVHFTGRQSDVAPLLAIMDLFVMPSYREGFGVTNLEAAALSVPVVSTRIPGCVDSVADGATGTLVPVRDSASLADAIDRYLTDPALRRAHGEAGRARVLEHFQPIRIWSELAALYRSIPPRRGSSVPAARLSRVRFR